MFAQPRIKKSAFNPPPKKRKTVHKIEEITYDRDARTEYLTGFRKRKQARIKHAQEQAEIKAREERIELRKQVKRHVCPELAISSLTNYNADQGGAEAECGGARPGHP